MISISLSRVHYILKNILNIKISARWMPHFSTDGQKKQRVKIARQLLKIFLKYDEKKFENVITGDETCVHYFEPVRKVSNKIWATKNSKRPVIGKCTLSAKKVLYAIFSGTGACEKGQKRYLKILQTCGIEEIEKIQEQYPVTGFIHVRLLHNNASAHTSAIVSDFLQKGKVTVLLHPAYSPDHAPCDFFLFPTLKTFLAGRRY